jgi:hypothetical protein
VIPESNSALGGGNQPSEHGKSLDKVRRIRYQFVCVRENLAAQPGPSQGLGWLWHCDKARIFGPVGRSSKAGTIDCPKGRKRRNPLE